MEKGKIERFKEGVAKLTPLQLLEAKMILYIGNFLGIILATIVLWYKGMWYFWLFMLCSSLLQLVEFVSVYKQYVQTKRIDEMIKTQTNELDLLMNKDVI